MAEINLNDNIEKVKGIGKKTAELFAKLGISRVNELIMHYPRCYDIYGAPAPISEAAEGELITIEAAIATRIELVRVRNLQIVSCCCKDPSGIIRLTWYNQPYLQKTLKQGYRFIFRGKVSRKNGSLCIDQPRMFTREEYRKLLAGMHPVYPVTEGLTSNAVAKAVNNSLDMLLLDFDFLPKRIKKTYKLMSYGDAIREIHFPRCEDNMREARRRLAFDEFLLFALSIRSMKEGRALLINSFHIEDKGVCSELIEGLPYRLTAAQLRVWNEVSADLERCSVMSRLVQGDVGSGKTIIAVLALLKVVSCGYQGCIMVPTEVLAVQHYESISGLLNQYGVRTELLVGSMSAAAKRKLYERIEMHDVDIIVGTHTLIQEKVHYDKLALVITDEQHRFGVRQREKLSLKGENPHVLVMSATPIPRSLAIILYGDLDISIIDELPANRLPIKNCVVDTGYREKALRFIKQQIKEGRQAYIICPMVEESENMEAENVIDYTLTVSSAFCDDSINVECLHGKMKPAVKNDIMERFAEGKIKCLISTTVVEVGVNVPNATVMLVENAERFGLAQLHQLRGRVGRGNKQSYCIFINGSAGKENAERLNILNSSNDGFYIAEQDLKLRGPGNIFGIEQSGEIEFSIGDIYADAGVVRIAGEAAAAMTDEEISTLYEERNVKFGSMHRLENVL